MKKKSRIGKGMKLKTLEELGCLLSAEERAQIWTRDKMAQRPSWMKTKSRLLPLLPKWMKRKLIEARELFDHNNTSAGDILLWNHTFTLPLDNIHDITFSMLDWLSCPKNLKKEVGKAIEVYKRLQVLYRKYNHPLTMISMQTDDFGMYLPNSFYTNNKETENENSLQPTTIEGFLSQLITPCYTRICRLEVLAAEGCTESMSESERIRFNTSFAYQHKNMIDYMERIKPELGSFAHDYYVQPNLETIDLYMNRRRYWTRELCVKWKVGEDLAWLKRFDSLRPDIEEIIELTKGASFAFGVKPRNTVVSECDYVNTFNHDIAEYDDPSEALVY